MADVLARAKNMQCCDIAIDGVISELIEEVEHQREIIAWVGTALPVLKTMCRVAGLRHGQAKAQEMLDAIREITEQR